MYAKKNLPELKFTDAEKTALQNYYEVWIMNYELWKPLTINPEW